MTKSAAGLSRYYSRKCTCAGLLPPRKTTANIIRHIQKDTPEAAAKVAGILFDGCGTLGQFPRRGRKGRIADTRELVFPGLPYIVVYRIQDQDLEILRIYHGAQDWP